MNGRQGKQRSRGYSRNPIEIGGSMAGFRGNGQGARGRVFLELLLGVFVFCTIACAEVGQVLVGVHGISAPELQDLLREESDVLVIDVRGVEKYEFGHIPRAISIGLDELDGYLTRAPIARTRHIVTVCEEGMMSLTAAAVVSAYGFKAVHSLEGGMDAWMKMELPLEKGSGQRPEEKMTHPPVNHISLASQVVMVVNGFVIKPLHMVVTLFLIVVLWYQRARDLVFIRWALAAFLFGEVMCAANYLFANDESLVLELLHDFGMIGFGILMPWGFFRMVDDRVLCLSNPEKPCAIRRFCQTCWKSDETICALQRIFALSCIALAIVALLPLMAPLRPFNVIWPVFGENLVCPLCVYLMIAEYRVFPLIAFLLLIVAAVSLRGGHDSIQKAMLPFFAGFGFLSFSLVRFMLFQGFRDAPGWALLWEELTELIAVVGVGYVLWLFRRQLGIAFLPRRSAMPREEPTCTAREAG